MTCRPGQAGVRPSLVNAGAVTDPVSGIRYVPDPEAAVHMLRRRLWGHGWRVIPILSWDHPDAEFAGKKPLGPKWQLAAQKDPPEGVTFAPVTWALNTGIWAGGLRPIDVDIEDAATVAMVLALATNHLGSDALRRTRANSPRTLLLYRAAEGEPKKMTLAGATNGHGKQLIEVLGHGQQFVAYGRHPSGADLEWPDGGPLETAMQDVPAVTEAQVADFLAAAAQVIGGVVPKPSPAKAQPRVADEPPPELAQITTALRLIANNGPADWESWNSIGMALWAATAGSDEGLTLWLEWSGRHPDYSEKAARGRWANYAKSPPDRTGAGKLFALAHDRIMKKQPGTNGQHAPSNDTTPDVDDPANEPPAAMPVRFSENALAYQFTAEHVDKLLYVHEWGRWLSWHDGCWRENHTVEVFDQARDLCRREGDIALAIMPTGGKAAAAAINKAATVAAIERLARHHAPHVRASDAFDTDRLLLNTTGGTAELRTGTVRQHLKADLMTRSATVTPAATADCPTWLAFLRRIMGGDQAIIDYLQRACGYMLSGLVTEHVLFFAHGTGANGKSTFADVLLGILGTGPAGYATVAPMSTFTATGSEQHPTDLAGLRGMRCVVAHETEEGRSWAVAKIKMMTGGDMITARFMRQDFFTYAPQFKVLILGNHRPSLHGVDEATRRRVHLIPFDVTIPAEERDKALPGKLRAEYPGILRWMLDGCVAWQEQGLQPPVRVVAATDEYFADEDTFGAWLTECCALSNDSRETLQTLFSSWQSWCEANGEYAGTRRRLGQRLAAHGLKRTRIGTDRTPYWLGIKVRIAGGGRL
jgi:P4 family phage/plasmid primase-like protien